MKQSRTVRALHHPLVERISETLDRGRASGAFRQDTDPVQLYISIAALGYFYLSNAHTLGTVFGRDLHAPEALEERRRHVHEVVSGYTYLQEWLPHVAEAAVSGGDTDLVGLGRMALSYPTLPMDVLSRQRVQRRLVCRTFSDCTTAPRSGMVSGCYPLDEHYKSRPEAEAMRRLLQERGGRR